MAIPTTYFSSQLLLIAAFLLLGLWSSTFKLAGNRWRYEFFSFDFALGAILFSLISAYTFGAFGAELGFSEHLMIASKTNQALAFLSGGFFAFGNMLLIAGGALLGLGFSYAIATGSAMLVLGVVEFAGFRGMLLAGAMAAAFLAIIFEVLGAKSAEATLPAVDLTAMVKKSAVRRTAKGRRIGPGMRNSSKGILVSIMGGVALGGAVIPFYNSVFSQFGLGTFAGVVMFFSGALAATLFLSFLLINIPVYGGPIGIKAYTKGSFWQHLLGLLGGAFCAGGMLLLTLLNAFPNEVRPDALWMWGAGLGASLLAIAMGLSKWHELSQASGSAIRSLMIGAILLIAAIGTFALAMSTTAPLPTALRQLLGHSQFLG